MSTSSPQAGTRTRAIILTVLAATAAALVTACGSTTSTSSNSCPATGTGGPSLIKNGGFDDRPPSISPWCTEGADKYGVLGWMMSPSDVPTEIARAVPTPPNSTEPGNDLYGAYLMRSSSSGEASFNQTITLNQGCYTLSLSVRASDKLPTGFLKATPTATPRAPRTWTTQWQQDTFSFQVNNNDTAVTVSIGFATDTTTPKAWIAIDNIELTLTPQYCQASPTTPNP